VIKLTITHFINNLGYTCYWNNYNYLFVRFGKLLIKIEEISEGRAPYFKDIDKHLSINDPTFFEQLKCIIEECH